MAGKALVISQLPSREAALRYDDLALKIGPDPISPIGLSGHTCKPLDRQTTC